MAKNFVSNKDETVRMFKSDFMEAFSRVHWTVPLFLFIPVIFYMLYRSFFINELSVLTIAGFMIFGLFIWTITEYTLHRFIFHWELKSDFGKRIHFIFHGVHHDYPSDSRRLVMPPSVSIPLASLFYFLFLVILGSVHISPFFAGFIIGYLFYDITHYALHHFNMHSKLWLELKNHHIKHHFQDPNKGYGVSSPLWDIIIGTDFPKTEDQKS
jgi:sterol desaturase/sphingolipid hydroxylase (fatty acid hydroxylase superfamily)